MVLVPGLALYLGWPATTIEAIAMAAAVLATAGFLIVGALYWRGVDRRLKGLGKGSLISALAFADRAERPLLALIAPAAAATAASILADGFTSASIAAMALTALAALEYVNYYRRQLQYFDNFADLKRLLTTGRLKRAHMARGLEDYRSRKGRA